MNSHDMRRLVVNVINGLRFREYQSCASEYDTFLSNEWSMMVMPVANEFDESTIHLIVKEFADSIRAKGVVQFGEIPILSGHLACYYQARDPVGNICVRIVKETNQTFHREATYLSALIRVPTYWGFQII